MSKTLATIGFVTVLLCAGGCGAIKGKVAEAALVGWGRGKAKVPLTADTSIRVMSWRADVGGDPAVAIAEEQADLIALHGILRDQVDRLIARLEERGLEYAVAASLDPEVEAMANAETLLVRRPSWPGEIVVEIHPAEAGVFATRASLPGGLEIRRGWLRVRAALDGSPFVLVMTQLEPEQIDIRVAQSAELFEGPAAASCTTVVVGDFHPDAPGELVHRVFAANGVGPDAED